MAESLKRFATVDESVEAPRKPKTSKPKISNPKRRQSDSEGQPFSSNNKQDFIGMLKDELRTPFLGLLEEYVKRCNPNKDGKDLGKGMFIFRSRHKWIIRFCFAFDFFLLSIFIFVVLYVGLRGLQINLPLIKW